MLFKHACVLPFDEQHSDGAWNHFEWMFMVPWKWKHVKRVKECLLEHESMLRRILRDCLNIDHVAWEWYHCFPECLHSLWLSKNSSYLIFVPCSSSLYAKVLNRSAQQQNMLKRNSCIVCDNDNILDQHALGWQISMKSWWVSMIASTISMQAFSGFPAQGPC